MQTHTNIHKAFEKNSTIFMMKSLRKLETEEIQLNFKKKANIIFKD